MRVQEQVDEQDFLVFLLLLDQFDLLKLSAFMLLIYFYRSTLQATLFLLLF